MADSGQQTMPIGVREEWDHTAHSWNQEGVSTEIIVGILSVNILECCEAADTSWKVEVLLNLKSFSPFEDLLEWVSLNPFHERLLRFSEFITSYT